MVQDNVGQERRNDAALRSANGGGFEDPIIHNPGRKKRLDKSEDISIGDLLSQSLHDDRMREVIKEAFDVGVQNKREALTVKADNGLDGHVAVATLAKAKGSGMEQRIKDRVEESAKNLLSNAIPNSGDAQGSEFLVILRNENAPKRLRTKRTVL
jgi:HEAT repeat protein